jgi:hypothetical protein
MYYEIDELAEDLDSTEMRLRVLALVESRHVREAEALAVEAGEIS